MRLTVDHQNLSLVCELDTEPEGMTLDGDDGLGNLILDSGVQGIIGSCSAEQAPDGQAWAPLQPQTAARKGHSRIGWQSGSMLSPVKLLNGPRDVGPRVATWSYPPDEPDFSKLQGFHGGRPGRQEARPVIGWTVDAAASARALVAEARHRLATGPPQPQDAGGLEANQVERNRVSQILEEGALQQGNEWLATFAGWNGGDWA